MPFLTAAAAQAIRADLRAVKRDLKAAVAAECHAEARRLRAEDGRVRDEYQRLIWEVMRREERRLRPSSRFDDRRLTNHPDSVVARPDKRQPDNLT